MTRRVTVAAVAVLALLAAPAAQADFFVRGYYSPVSGTVGRLLVSDASFGVDDMPAQCLPAWDSISVTGALPPGISPPGADVTDVTPEKTPDGIPVFHASVPDVAASAFSGTPRKAGDFPVAVTFHGLSCAGQKFGDRTIKVNFHIGA
jgi:hypothetical protein